MRFRFPNGRDLVVTIVRSIHREQWYWWLPSLEAFTANSGILRVSTDRAPPVRQPAPVRGRGSWLPGDTTVPLPQLLRGGNRSPAPGRHWFHAADPFRRHRYGSDKSRPAGVFHGAGAC